MFGFGGVFNPAFNLFAMEQEGLLDTTDSLMNRFLKELSTQANPQDPDVYNRVAQSVGLNLSTLTGIQLRYLADEIQKM